MQCTAFHTSVVFLFYSIWINVKLFKAHSILQLIWPNFTVIVLKLHCIDHYSNLNVFFFIKNDAFIHSQIEWTENQMHIQAEHSFVIIHSLLSKSSLYLLLFVLSKYLRVSFFFSFTNILTIELWIESREVNISLNRKCSS